MPDSDTAITRHTPGPPLAAASGDVRAGRLPPLSVVVSTRTPWPAARAALDALHPQVEAVGARRLEATRLPLPGVFDRLDFFLAERTWDVSKGRRELGFEARIGLEAGLVETARWYEEHGWIA